MKLFDTHAHFWDERFEEELGADGLDRLLTQLLRSTVPHIVNVATDPETAELAVEQAKRYPGMLTALGIHPNDGQDIADPEFPLYEIEQLLLDPASHAVALGEIGLDYHYDDTDRAHQQALFQRIFHLLFAAAAVAFQTGLAVVAHAVDVF